MAIRQGPNQRWSLDFVADALSWDRRFRVLAVVDDFTREALCLVVDTSIGGERVVCDLESVIARRGRPATIVSDNGTELTLKAVLDWTNRSGVESHYIAPGKPTQNAFVETFNGRLRDDNQVRPHSAHGGLTPQAALLRSAGDRLRKPDQLLRSPATSPPADEALSATQDSHYP
ncbi:integrase-like protein [Tepidamorphus gemmatus]|uniref:Integrase-like protein n=1 Tax=Tepidamorphus gemmatus TaxID=747076 RepID=A0A4R3LXS2_9HYPH|nr:integrase-like protein [Tepidamorphus gemmatus]